MPQSMILNTQPFLDRETEDVPVILVTLRHKSLKEPVLFCADNLEIFDDYDNTSAPLYGVTSTALDGVTPRRYLFCPMSVTLPSQHGEETNAATLSIDNVSRPIVETVRSMQMRDGYATIQFQMLVLPPGDYAGNTGNADDPRNVVIADFSELNLTDITYSRMTMTGTLAVSNLNGEPFPGRTSRRPRSHRWPGLSCEMGG